MTRLIDASTLTQEPLLSEGEPRVPEKHLSISSSLAQPLEQILNYLANPAQNTEFKKKTAELDTPLSDQEILDIYKGQQLHMLCYFLIIVMREFNLYTDTYQHLSSISNTPVFFQIPELTLRMYFPTMDKPILHRMARLINQRIQELPFYRQNEQNYNELDQYQLDPEARKIQAVDVFQLVFDIWNDWRRNQIFDLKRGSLDKKSSSYPTQKQALIEKYQTLWLDQHPAFSRKIQLAALEILATWKAILIDEKPPDTQNTNILELLLDPQNVIELERLINIKFILDELAQYASQAEATILYTILIRGVPDVIIWKPVTPGRFEPVVIDFKSTLREINTLEILLTQIQGWVSCYTDPTKSYYPLKSAWLDGLARGLTFTVGDVQVYHVNPQRVSNGEKLDFEQDNKTLFNLWETVGQFTQLLEDALRQLSTVTDQLNRYRKHGRLPVKTELTEYPEITPRIPLPDFNPEINRFFQMQDKSRRKARKEYQEAPDFTQLSLGEEFTSSGLSIFSNRQKQEIGHRLYRP